MTAIPASHEVVDGALRLVVTMAAAMVGGADGVSVSLRRHGTLMTVAASDSTISAMDADQYQTGEGPCVDASLQGQRFHASSLATETRWPTFTPRAQALGINAILSSPLAANNRPVGALNIYSRTSGAFGPQDEGMASLFAQETSTVLSAAGVDVTDQEMADRLAEALASRHIVALAQGVLMERSGCDEDDAYTLLRRYSAQTGQPLQARAKQIVASTRPQDGLWSGPEPRRA